MSDRTNITGLFRVVATHMHGTGPETRSGAPMSRADAEAEFTRRAALPGFGPDQGNRLRILAEDEYRRVLAGRGAVASCTVCGGPDVPNHPCEVVIR